MTSHNIQHQAKGFTQHMIGEQVTQATKQMDDAVWMMEPEDTVSGFHFPKQFGVPVAASVTFLAGESA